MAATRTDLGSILAAIDRRRGLARLTGLGLGAAMALGLAPHDLPLLTVLALALALRLQARAGSRRDGALFGFCLGLGFFLMALQWIIEPFLVDVARHGWMAPFALIFMAAGMALFWAGAFWLAWGAGPRGGPRRGLAAVLALTLAEMLRSVLFTGFPWALIGSVWVNHPVGQLAAFWGTHGLTFFTGVLAVGVLTLSVWQASRRALLASGITVLAWAGGTFLGERMILAYEARPAASAPMVRVVQPNETQALKWQAEMIPIFWQRKLDLTASRTEATPDVIVWPEVSLPYLLDRDPLSNATISEAAGGVPVIVGAQRFEGRELRNSLAVIGPGGALSHIYDKHHLVPFGEYFPGGRLAAWLGLEGLATDMLGGFSAGPGPRILDLGAPLGRILPQICYESIFPRHARALGQGRPDWIVLVTNDAWFGRFAGPKQHLDQARLRAIEQGLPVVRAANTGISAVIDASGRVLGQLPMDTAGIIDRPIPAAKSGTLYAAIGNGPLLLLLMVLSVWLVRSRIVKGD